MGRLLIMVQIFHKLTRKTAPRERQTLAGLVMAILPAHETHRANDIYRPPTLILRQYVFQDQQSNILVLQHEHRHHTSCAGHISLFQVIRPQQRGRGHRLTIIKGREGAICAPLVAASWGPTGSTPHLTLPIVAPPLPAIVEILGKGVLLVVVRSLAYHRKACEHAIEDN